MPIRETITPLSLSLSLNRDRINLVGGYLDDSVVVFFAVVGAVAVPASPARSRGSRLLLASTLASRYWLDTSIVKLMGRWLSWAQISLVAIFKKDNSRCCKQCNALRRHKHQSHCLPRSN